MIVLSICGCIVCAACSVEHFRTNMVGKHIYWFTSIAQVPCNFMLPLSYLVLEMLNTATTKLQLILRKLTL